MSFSVAIAGASGYAGGEILRLLLGHPLYRSGELTIGALTGASNAGESLASLMPHIPELADRVLEPTTPEVLGEHDIVFLALPHGHSAAIAEVLPAETLIIDCGADFRLKNAADWEHYYGSPWAGSWTYGIPEMPGHREELTTARRIAVPGCFPTGATLAALPAIAGGLVEPDLAVVSFTGVSGAGKKAAVPMLGSEVMGSAKAYNTAGRHRHTPEMAQNLGEYCDEPVTVSFTPVLAPMTRGILTTISAHASASLLAIAEADPAAAAQAVTATYQGFYAEEQFIHVLPEGDQPITKSVVGSNMVHVQAEYDPISQRVLMVSAIDNLTKGTAGAAVQCMNIAQGWDEGAGLPKVGLAP